METPGKVITLVWILSLLICSVAVFAQTQAVWVLLILILSNTLTVVLTYVYCVIELPVQMVKEALDEVKDGFTKRNSEMDINEYLTADKGEHPIDKED